MLSAGNNYVAVRAASSYRERKKEFTKKAAELAAKHNQTSVKPETPQVQVQRSTSGFILGKWTPLPKGEKPSIFSKKGLKYTWRSLMQSVLSTGVIALVRHNVKGFSPVAFAEEAQKLYIDSRQALARDDKKVVFDNVCVEFAHAIKQELRVPHTYIVFQTLERPKIVNATMARVEKGKKNFYVQVTVRTVLERRETNADGYVQLFKSPEYIVLERQIRENSLGQWRVIGRMPKISLNELLAKPKAEKYSQIMKDIAIATAAANNAAKESTPSTATATATKGATTIKEKSTTH